MHSASRDAGNECEARAGLGKDLVEQVLLQVQEEIVLQSVCTSSLHRSPPGLMAQVGMRGPVSVVQHFLFSSSATWLLFHVALSLVDITVLDSVLTSPDSGRHLKNWDPRRNSAFTEKIFFVSKLKNAFSPDNVSSQVTLSCVRSPDRQAVSGLTGQRGCYIVFSLKTECRTRGSTLSLP